MASKVENHTGKAMISSKTVPLTMLAVVFLVSFSVLLLEITFTRILSVILSYHYVFVVISMALLGLGFGGVFAYFARTKINSGNLPVLGSILVISVLASVFGIIKTGSASMFLNSVIVLVPFTFAGIILSNIFQVYASQSGRIYAADLIGAAAGALLAVPLLNRLSAINVGLLIGIFASVAAVILFLKFKAKAWLPIFVPLLAITLFFTGIFAPGISNIILKPGLQKEMVAQQSGGLSGTVNSQLLETRWSSFGRTDLVNYDNKPDAMWIFTDATAGTGMYQFSGDLNNPGISVINLQYTFSGGFPLRYLAPEQKDNALIIGAGGGRDVLIALTSGIKDITAVEVNPDTIDLVKEYSGYNGGIYTDFPNVNVVVAEGRSYLSRQNEKYDVIMLSIPVTKTSRSPEGFALTENFLFTSESIADYYDHLTDNGRLVVVNHNPAEAMRLMTLSHTALKNLPAADVMDRMYTLSSHHDGVFVLSKNKIDPQESYLVHQILHANNMDPRYSYLPYINTEAADNHIQELKFDQCQMLNPALIDMGMGKLSEVELVNGLAQQGVDISAVSDVRPFFYNAKTGIPGTLSSALTLSIIFLLGIITVPGLLAGKNLKGKNINAKMQINPGVFVIIFTLLGAGFMLAEIPLIQMFTLFLGEPVLSISVLLFSLLIGAGIGGLTSGRISPRGLSKKLGFIAAGIALLLLVYALATPLVLKQFLGLSLIERSLLSGVLLIPLGFALGFPFPLIIKLMRETGASSRIPWMWGINGGASVLGSVLAVILAMKVGFAWAMIAGAICYFITWLVLRLSSSSFEQKLIPPVITVSSTCKDGFLIRMRHDTD